MQRLDDETLIQSVQELAEELGHPPSTVEMAEHGPHSTRTYQRRWESWGHVLLEAGLAKEYFRNRGRGSNTPETLLLSHLRDLADDHDGRLSSSMMDEEGWFTSATYVIRFGSWEDALAAAGIETGED